MKILVLGCGLMGRAISLDLVESPEVERVTATDVSREKLKALEVEAKNDKLSTRRFNTADRSKLVDLIRKFDLVTNALPHAFSVAADRAAIKARVSVVDVSFEDDHMRLDDAAKQAGVTIIPGCGVAPGLTNVLAAHAFDQLDKTESVEMMCGGLTPKPSSPLLWKFVFNLEGAWGLYLRRPRIVRDRKVIDVDPRSGLEKVSFPDPFDDLEAFYTDGLASLLYTMKEKIPNMVEKTIRWPGNLERIGVLAECGLLSDRPVKIDGAKVSPKQFNSLVMAPFLELGDERDVTLLRVEAVGEKNHERIKLRYDMLDHYDEKKRITSMGRTTAYPCTVAAMMIGRGHITTKGVVPPEIAIRDAQFQEFETELNKRNVKLQRTEARS